MKTLEIENDLVRAVLLVDKGADIVELRYKPLELDVLWHAPSSHRSPRETSMFTGDSQTAFTDVYGGGWQDVLPVMGDGPTRHRGALFGLHGETPLLPWDGPLVEKGDDEVSAVVTVRGLRYPYEVRRKLTLRKGEPLLRIEEELTNTSHQDLEFFWLQHPAYGEPFLAPGCMIDLPEGTQIHPLPRINPNGRLADETTVWPFAVGRKGERIDLSVIPARQLRAEETTFLKVAEPWYSLRNPTVDLGLALRWDLSIHPWLWFWQNYNQPDYPWYGEAWNVAIEPSSSFPGTTEEHLKTGTYLLVRGKQSLSSDLTVSFCKGKTKVVNVDRLGNAEQR